MHSSTLISCFLIAFTSFVNADKWVQFKDDYFVATGCKLSLEKYGPYCAKSSKGDTCMCASKYALASWAYCGYQNKQDVSPSKIEDQIVQICAEGTKIKNLTKDYVEDLYNEYKGSVIDIDNDKTYNSTNHHVVVTGKTIEKYAYRGFISNQHRYGNLNTSHYMGIAFVSAVGFVTIIAGLFNWFKRLSRKFANSGTNKVSNGYRKYFSLGLLGNHLHNNKLGGVNPDRVEALLIFIMFLYSILCCTIIGFHYFKGDTTFKTYQAGTSRYYGDRSAILLSYQLPLLFIFPGRNNFFQYITRWKYSRFITFHKWLARIILLEVFIHSFAMSSQTYALKKYARFGKDWYRYGICGCVLFALIILCSFSPFRRRFYEVFVCIHVVFVTMFLWTTWRHAQSQDYQDFYWACAGIWIFDRVIRICRILSYGGPRTSEIELFEGEDVLKITVQKSKLIVGSPGSHAFIHFLDPLRFWQSHPFTVYPSQTNPDAVTFTCRVKKGMTKYIADKCKASPDKKIQMKICIDGFYGEQSEYQYYDKSVFITGGTGIAGPYYHAKKLIESDSTKEVKLYWSVRTYECIKWFIPELLAFKNTNLKPIIYVSRPDESISSGSGSSDNDENKDSSLSEKAKTDDVLEILDFVEIKHGHLSVEEVVKSEIMESQGSIAIGACAHTQVVDQVRRTVANNLNLSSHKIEYFEEMQQW